MKWYCIIVFLSISIFISAQGSFQDIMSQKERAVWVDSMLEYRMEFILPDLMRREGIDMWILISREYNEDPVMKTMLPSEWLSARRRTIMVFYDPGKGQPIEKVAIEALHLLKGDERRLQTLDGFGRSRPAEVTGSCGRQQVEADVCRRSPVRDGRLRRLLEIVRRQHVACRRDKCLEEAPGSTGNEP